MYFIFGLSFLVTLLLAALFVLSRRGNAPVKAQAKKKSPAASANKTVAAASVSSISANGVSVTSGKAFELVKSDLARLPSTYTVLNKCSIDTILIDHLVVSLSGIVVVKSVDHLGSVSNSGQVLCYDGKEVSRAVVSSAWDQALIVKKFLKEQCGSEYFVKVILCFPQAYVAVQEPIDSAAIVNLEFLRPVIMAHRTFVKSEHAKELIQSVYSTW